MKETRACWGLSIYRIWLYVISNVNCSATAGLKGRLDEKAWFRSLSCADEGRLSLKKGVQRENTWATTVNIEEACGRSRRYLSGLQMQRRLWGSFQYWTSHLLLLVHLHQRAFRVHPLSDGTMRHELATKEWLEAYLEGACSQLEVKEWIKKVRIGVRQLNRHSLKVWNGRHSSIRGEAEKKKALHLAKGPEQALDEVLAVRVGLDFKRNNRQPGSDTWSGRK